MKYNIKIMIKYIAFVALLSLTIFSCEEQAQATKCDYIDCSGKGKCYIDSGSNNARCKCDDGYYERGESCIEYSCRNGYKLEGTNCIKTCLECQGDDKYTSDPCENIDCSNHGYCTSDIDRVIYCLCYSGYKNEAGIFCVESDCDGVSCASGK